MPWVKIQTLHKGILHNYEISLPPANPQRPSTEAKTVNNVLCILLGIFLN